MKIKNILVKEIFDSRGEPTIEVGVSNLKGNWFFAQISSGKSRGKNEAAVLGAKKAESALRNIKKEIIGRDFKSIGSLDKKLIKLDGTKNKSRLGGNLMLGISIAFARALASEKNKEIWQVLRQEFFPKAKNKNPYIFSNLINGGAHAENTLSIQEYLVIAKPRKSINASVKNTIKIYKALGEFLKKQNKLENLSLGDEGGYSLNFKNNFEPFEILERVIKKLNLQKEFLLGMDAAASQFYKNNKYDFDGKKVSNDELSQIYNDYFHKLKILFSIEDPFAEKDFQGFKNLKQIIKNALIVGDDLTATNSKLIAKFARQNLINSVIMKPNQIGTITETCEAIKTAEKNKLKVIISHRSGETEDNFIIHLAKACSAFGVKIGAPARERIFKFDELIELYE